MKYFQIIVSEEELSYIRIALCEKIGKHICKRIDCRNHGDINGANYNEERRDIGTFILNKIDTFRKDVEK